MRILISLSWPKGPGGWPASLAGSNYFEIRSQGLVWRRRRSESCECLTASGNLNLNWAQAAEGLGPGHCQACLTGRLRSLQDSRWCSGNHSRAWLRLPLATSTGPRPLKIVMDVRKIKIYEVSLPCFTCEFSSEKKFPDLMYFSVYGFTCEIIEEKSILIPVGTDSAGRCRRGKDYFIFAKFLQELFCIFAALANGVSAATCKIYNLLRMFTRYLSLPNGARLHVSVSSLSNLSFHCSDFQVLELGLSRSGIVLST